MASKIDTDELRDEALDILSAHEHSEYVGYSGRGMFGRDSPLAFETEVHPESKEGLKLRALGFIWDNMGLDFIYYLR
jgi:hypothetical protein